MEVTADTLVRDIVLNVPGGVVAMERLRIDYCCGGSKTLRRVAAESGMRLDWILETIARERASGGATDAELLEVPLVDLVTTVVEVHHETSRRAAQAIRDAARKALEARPGDAVLIELAARADVLFGALLPHLVHEERNLFPYVRELERAASDPGAPPPVALFSTIRHVLEDMEREHERCDVELQAMRALTNDYSVDVSTPPESRELFEALAAHEKDLVRHMHLEGNVVFPRAERLETWVQARARRRRR